ncbi:tripartite tricarboxylate transporter permease [Flavonifractor sp. An100]|uniref:tripartite tricarboxylate transporter permease n=1 Tax=Flavonifractor sp. An100 TaxID=1965538 RepID=UPI000B383060|nr:tripartite tricarboxylate transporter permease [Flavonifractor sp. An100]OUQ77246.1 trap-t family transporter [Flavonifractor sp. An100]
MDLLILGLQAILEPVTMLWILFGTIIGVIFGALPGVSSTMAIVLCVSFTYVMDPVVAIAFLATVYCAAITGGSVTAILFKIPGTPSSAATVLDGYPMAARGEAGRALTISLVCSAIGGIISALFMFFLTQPMMDLAIKFSAAEQFAVALLGLSVLVFLDQKHMLNTFSSALLGLFLATIGMDNFSSVPRFTFGQDWLLDGMDSLPFMLGMFAAVEVYNEIVSPSDRSAYQTKGAKLTKLAPVRDFIEMKGTIIRSALIGTFVGILPGAGSNISGWLAYTVESKFSKHPELLGTGDPHGVAACETANNAATGGAMVPMLSMGIPGSNAAAMMMAALTIQGVQLGPMLLKAQPEYLGATFCSMFLANILMVFVSLIMAKGFARILSMPYWMLGTFILALAFTGCYASRNSMTSVYVMLAGSVLGYFLKKYHFNIPALILGLVLGPILERQFRRGMQMADSVGEFFSRPITLGILAIVVIMYTYAFIKMVRDHKAENA